MNDKIKRFVFYNIFFLCAFFSLFMVLNLKSFASSLPSGSYSVQIKYILGFGNGSDKDKYRYSDTIYGFHTYDDNRRFCLLRTNGDAPSGFTYFNYVLISNKQDSISYSLNQINYGFNGDIESTYNSNKNYLFSSTNLNGITYYRTPNLGYTYTGYDFASNIRVFDNLSDAVNYVSSGLLPSIPFDDTLKLDSFKVTSWRIGTSQLVFRSKFEVTWSDDRIANVQVRIVGTANSPATFERNISPFKQKFYADHYVMKNGDIIHLTATPFKSNGEYGESLYYAITYDDGLPSNWYRKLVNTPYNDNTLTIPYNNVSGQPTSVTLPVDSVTTQNVYKVNYNPVTYEYGDLNLYEIYYSPVVIYSDAATDEEIEETQEVVNNTYTTNNYYETTKNINFDFDVSFGDISGSDIQIGYDNTGSFLNSLGTLISKLSSWVLALFPFLPPIVATSIVVVFGLVVSVAVIAFALKIASVIADFIDAIIPG